MTAPNQDAHDYDVKTGENILPIQFPIITFWYTADELVGSLFFKAIVTVSLTQKNVPSELLVSFHSIKIYAYLITESFVNRNSMSIGSCNSMTMMPPCNTFEPSE